MCVPAPLPHPPWLLLQVLGEDLVLVQGQQRNMARGAGVHTTAPALGVLSACRCACFPGCPAVLSMDNCLSTPPMLPQPFLAYSCPTRLPTLVPALPAPPRLQMCGPTPCLTISWEFATAAGATQVGVACNARWAGLPAWLACYPAVVCRLLCLSRHAGTRAGWLMSVLAS